MNYVCQIRVMLHHSAMRPILWLPFSCAVILTLSGCANNGGSSSAGGPSGTGPFDSQGNYHEEWANDPSKWRKPGSHSQAAAPSDEMPVIAKNEQPPLNASPFAAPEPTKPKTSAARTSPASRATTRHTDEPKAVTSKRKPTRDQSTARKSSSHVDHDQPGSQADKAKSTKQADKTSARKATASIDEDTPKPKTTSKAAPKATTKATAKSAPKSPVKGARYTVKKGDSLYTIAEHSNSSAAEIRKANGISGNSVQPGKRLVIPK